MPSANEQQLTLKEANLPCWAWLLLLLTSSSAAAAALSSTQSIYAEPLSQTHIQISPRQQYLLPCLCSLSIQSNLLVFQSPSGRRVCLKSIDWQANDRSSPALLAFLTFSVYKSASSLLVGATFVRTFKSYKREGTSHYLPVVCSFARVNHLLRPKGAATDS